MERKITPLAEVRKQMIERIESLVRKKQVKDENGGFFVPLYSDADYDKNISIRENSEDVWFIRTVTVPARALGMNVHDGVTVNRTVVGTNNYTYCIDELYADDIETIMNRLETISEEDIKTNTAWYLETL